MGMLGREKGIHISSLGRTRVQYVEDGVHGLGESGYTAKETHLLWIFLFRSKGIYRSYPSSSRKYGSQYTYPYAYIRRGESQEFYNKDRIVCESCQYTQFGYRVTRTLTHYVGYGIERETGTINMVNPDPISHNEGLS